jgi:hypothetical protein
MSSPRPKPSPKLLDAMIEEATVDAYNDEEQAETRRLLEKARKNNSVRLIEVLERDEQSLSRIFEGVDRIEADHADGDGFDLRDFAAPDQTEGG